MVQASTLVLAAFAIAPVLSAPLTVTQAEAFKRSVDAVDTLELRDPKFSLGKLVKGVAGVVKKAAPIAASILLRDVDGNLVERSIDLEGLDTRDPKFSFGKLVKGVAGVVKKAAPIAASVLLRDVDGNLIERSIDLDDLELDSRDLSSDVEDLDLRDPKFSFGKIVKGVAGVVKKAAPIAASILLRDVDGTLVERSIEIDDLDLRDPKFSFGKLVKGVAGVVKKAAPIAASILLRDEEGNVYIRDIDLNNLSEIDARDFYYASDDSVFERDVLDALEDLDARDPKFRLGNILKKVTNFAGKAAGVAGKVANVAGALAGREFEDFEEMEARSIDDLD